MSSQFEMQLFYLHISVKPTFTTLLAANVYNFTFIYLYKSLQILNTDAFNSKSLVISLYASRLRLGSIVYLILVSGHQ